MKYHHLNSFWLEYYIECHFQLENHEIIAHA